MKGVLINWNIGNADEVSVNFHGSPERALGRTAYKTPDGSIYILESILDTQKKQMIAETVHELYEKGMPVSPCLRSTDGEFIVEKGLRNYQLSKFVEGIELERPDYVKDGWRGKVLAEFLIALRRIKPYGHESGFSLKEYIRPIAQRLNCVYIYDFLEDFFNAKLDFSFCHGDLHPLNVIWGEKRINAVIDWEFCGNNYRAYDVANLLGCIGIENPVYLHEAFAFEFLRKLKKADYFKDSEIEYLPELMLAIRFGWLSEWIRKNDHEMIELELAYMNFLKNNNQMLKKEFKTEK